MLNKYGASTWWMFSVNFILASMKERDRNCSLEREMFAFPCFLAFHLPVAKTFLLKLAFPITANQFDYDLNCGKTDISSKFRCVIQFSEESLLSYISLFCCMTAKKPTLMRSGKLTLGAKSYSLNHIFASCCLVAKSNKY